MLEVEARALAEAARWLLPAVPAKSSNPAMTAITLRTSEERLILGAWDYELQATVAVGCDGELVANVSAHTFADVAERLTGTARLALAGKRLAITDGRRKYQIAVMASDNYPPPPPEVKAQGEAYGFAAAFAQAAVATSKDSPLLALRAVQVQTAGGWLTMRATDKYQVARLAIPWRGEPFMAFVLAGKVGTAIKGWPGLITIGCDANRIGIAHGDRDVAINAVAVPEGEVPNYDRALEPYKDGVTATITVDRAALLDAVKAIAVVTPRLQPIQLKAADGGLLLSGKGDDLGAGEVPVDADIEGDLPEKLGYNADYLAGSLGVFADAEIVRIRIINARRPMLLQALDGDANDVTTHQHLLMPIVS